MIVTIFPTRGKKPVDFLRGRFLPDHEVLSKSVNGTVEVEVDREDLEDFLDKAEEFGVQYEVD